MSNKEPFAEMVNFFSSLPGVGNRTALKYVYYLIEHKEAMLNQLDKVKSNLLNLHQCKICNNFTTSDLCHICLSHRDTSKIMILEDYKDISVIEDIGIYKGLYHIISSKLNLSNGIDFSHIDFDQLSKRITPDIKEIIIATSLTLEGEVLAAKLEEMYHTKTKVSRLSRGVPYGSSIANLDPITIKESLKRRYINEANQDN